MTIDALYAFTGCELSVSPNACVIIEGDKPHFITVEEILQVNTEQTKELLRQELLIRQRELEEKIHFANLEKIFIEQRIYRDIEGGRELRAGAGDYPGGPEEVRREPEEKRSATISAYCSCATSARRTSPA